jgi:hypothetical protein
MMGNTEFVRNLWIEAKLPRLVVLTALLGALFLLVWLWRDRSATLSTAALTAYVAIIFIWGNRLAANSVIQEVNNGTWDSQRMSAISPFAMTLGKLFGSTILVWFGGLICLGVYWWSKSAGGYDIELLQTTIIYLGCGLLSHIVSLIVSLIAIRKRRAGGRLRVWLYQFIGLIAALPILILASRTIEANVLATFIYNTNLNWYGVTFSKFDFIVMSIAIYAVWGIIGVNRMMRMELLARNSPLLWLGFVLFTAMFVAGIELPGFFERSFSDISSSETIVLRVMMMGALASLLLAYVIVLAEPKGKTLVVFLKRHAAERRWREFFDATPRWAATLILVLIMIVSIWAYGQYQGHEFGHDEQFWATIGIVFLFVARDIGFIALMSFWISTPRADMTALVCLALSYTLIPALFFAAGVYSLRPLFQPVFLTDIHNNFGLIAIETGVLYLILAFTVLAVAKTETAGATPAPTP